MEATAKHITVAAIDLGSNSFRLMIAMIRNGKTSPLVKKLRTVRLGLGLRSSDMLSQEAMERAYSAIEAFRKEISCYSVDCCRCYGTEALRKATNAQSFLTRAAAIIGQEVIILTGDQEAILSCNGALSALEGKPPFPLMVVDVGGSSTEITCLSHSASPPQTASIAVGALGLSELAGKSTHAHLREHLVGEISAFSGKSAINPGQLTIIATGGTATALASLDLHLEVYDEKKIHGHPLDLKKLNLLTEKLGSLSDAELSSLPGIDQGRGNILPAGLEIYQEIIATIGVDGMIVSDAGLLEGIALSCLDQPIPLPSFPAESVCEDPDKSRKTEPWHKNTGEI